MSYYKDEESIVLTHERPSERAMRLADAKMKDENALIEFAASYWFHHEHPRSSWKQVAPTYKQMQQRDRYRNGAKVFLNRLRERMEIGELPPL